MTSLFWWSPMHMLPLLRPEPKFNGRGWAQVVARTRMPMRNFGDDLSPLVSRLGDGLPSALPNV
nr:hypothetical protein [uncultured Rhodococcus sp.]